MVKSNYLSEEKEKYNKEFGEAWETVYKFFYNDLDFGGASYIEKKIPLKQRRFSCAKELITLYGYDAVFKAMSIYREKLRLGILYKKSVPYFKKIVENVVVKEPEIIKVMAVIPIPKEKVTEAYGKTILNWSYNCPDCSTVIDAWNERCPKCDKWFDWGKVDVDY